MKTRAPCGALVCCVGPFLLVFLAVARRPPLTPHLESAAITIKDREIVPEAPAAPEPSRTRGPPVRANHADIAESVHHTAAWLCRARHDGRVGCEHLSLRQVMAPFAVHRHCPRGGRNRQG